MSVTSDMSHSSAGVGGNDQFESVHAQMRPKDVQNKTKEPPPPATQATKRKIAKPDSRLRSCHVRNLKSGNLREQPTYENESGIGKN